MDTACQNPGGIFSFLQAIPSMKAKIAAGLAIVVKEKDEEQSNK